MTLDVNIFSIPRQPDFEEDDVCEVNYLDNVVDEYFGFLQYEDPVESTLTHFFFLNLKLILLSRMR